MNPAYVLRNKRKVEEYISYQEDKRQRTEKKKPWLGCEGPNNYQDAEIAKWLNDNLGKPRKFKQPQLFISGPKNMGKTTLIEQLREYFNIYDIPLNEDFYDFYADNRYDLAVIDEFKGQKPIQWLNLFLLIGIVTGKHIY